MLAMLGTMRRSVLLLAGLASAGLFWAGSARANDDDKAWAALKVPGTVVLFRHAIAPGGGDPPGYVLNDCTTQRNLDQEGRDQARRIGERFRAQGIKVEAVLSSQWCRTRETAQLAFPGQSKDAPAFNSFFNNRGTETTQTASALKQLREWRGAGVLVVVTHQVNITALTGVFAASGEGVVLHRQGRDFAVVAKITP
jgi:phosphohistidine phosphatase SixA